MQLIISLRLVALLFPVLCVADPIPLPLPEPEPDAEADPDPQTYTNNAPFSGAIYIVNPNGQAVTTAQSNVCPNYAPLSCSNINQPSWCCPNGYTCASPANSNGLIGCCPSGQSCAGTVNVASVTTVTVQAAQQTAVVYANPQPTQVVTQAAAGGFCATLTMNGPGLPTTRQGECGTILIVSEGSPTLMAIGYGMGAVLVLFHLAIGRLFHWF